MGIIEKIRNMIEDNPIEKLDREKINKEKARLEKAEKRKQQEVDRLSKQKKELFFRGFNLSGVEQRSLARKIIMLDRKIKSHTKHLEKLSKNIRVCDNLLFVQENQEIFERMDPELLAYTIDSDNVFNTKENSEIEELIEKLAYTIDSDNVFNYKENPEIKELIEIWNTYNEEDAEEVFKEWEKKKSEEK